MNPIAECGLRIAELKSPKKLVDTEEAAKILGVTSRAIRKKFTKGKLEGEFRANNRGGKSGMKLYVYINDPSTGSGRCPDNPSISSGRCPDDPSTGSGQGSDCENASQGDDEQIEILSGAQDDKKKKQDDKKKKLRTRIHPAPVRCKVNRGEPGCHVVTPIQNGEPVLGDGEMGKWGDREENPPTNNIPISKLDSSQNVNSLVSVGCSQNRPSGNGDHNKAGGEGVAVIEAPPSGNSSLLGPPKEPSPDGGAISNLPAIVGKGVSVNSPKSLRIANLRFAVIQAFNEEAAKNHRPRKEIIPNFLSLYNSGHLLPDIHSEIKHIKRSTLYNWLQLCEQGGIDALVPQYRGVQGSEILSGERDYLLKFLLKDNKPKISDGIRECKRYLGQYSTSGPSSLRRFINQFKTQYHDVWTLRRGGEKAWNDEDAPYQDRDPMLLNVGDVVVADGHKLNVSVVDPLTGKKRRATLVLFWDWKSTYPLGWEIMFSENIQCIAVALRNALLTLGKIPGNIYIDNGRAFLAKIFTRKIRIEETEIPGMIARLGSQYRRAMPYHGQSKPIERFFLIINDRLERRLPSYMGSSIKDKPAYLLRNEPLAKQLHDNWVPTVDDVFNIMLQWREEYIDEPRPRRQGLTARQIFDEGKGAGLDPKALCFLMMAIEVKRVSRSRFTFAGVDWEGPCIYGFKGRVIIRYSLSDFSKIYVFDINDRYMMGTVTQCGKADPIKDWQAAKRIVAERRKLKKGSKEFAAFLVEGRKNPDLIEYIEGEEVKKLDDKRSPFPDSGDRQVATSVPARADELPSNVEQTERPRWKYDYEKYDWLMEQDELTEADRKWIDDYRASSSLYKHIVFDDAEKLDQKVTGVTNERPFCSDQVD
jgi:putative transposase